MNEVQWIVTAQAIERYAKSVENMYPPYLSESSAREEGFDRLIAPTSFCGQHQMFFDPLEYLPKGAVHTRQKMSFRKTIQAGDSITAKIDTLRGQDSKGRGIIICKTKFVNQFDEVVCEGEMTLLANE